jgi:hypothetical protein
MSLSAGEEMQKSPLAVSNPQAPSRHAQHFCQRRDGFAGFGSGSP